MATTRAPWATLHTAQRLSDKLLSVAPALPSTPTQASSGNDPDFPLKHQAERPSKSVVLWTGMWVEFFFNES